MHAANRILMVDDDAAVLRSYAEELGDRGWIVRSCARGDEASTRLETESYDVVAHELTLPDRDGWTFLQHVCAHHPDTAVVVTSATIDVDAAVRAMRMGARDVWRKPVATAELPRRLHEIMRARPAKSVQPSGQRSSAPVPNILGQSQAIRAIRDQIRTVARYRDLSVLITGETGTGKELVAQSIHAASATNAPFVPVNCAALPEPLFESELFGHEAGAFTGARGARAGLFEAAANGTLFLDEIGELPASLQPKLLRALESRAFRRIGSSRDLPFRARVISATHRSLLGADPALRSDLYYRLAGFTIAIPALRDDISDIEILAQHFLSEFSLRYGLELTLSPHALAALHAHDWPGNVRELRAVVEQAAVLAPGDRIGVAELMMAFRDRQPCARREGVEAAASGVMLAGASHSLRDMERHAIQETWTSSGHNLSAAARVLGLPRTTLRDRLRKYGLR
ncbi:MAG TPA: sigma-54 dependent transcriptional regulator [Polyangiaceae bacterium]|jgi:DNA-binding NtrC family response regulator